MKRTLLAAGIVLALVVGVFAAATVGAQEGSPTPSPSGDAEDTPTPAQSGDDESDDQEQRPRDRFADLLAENLGISREELDEALKQTRLDLIDEALAEGKITEEQAEEARERVENGEPVFPWFGHGPNPPFPHEDPFYSLLENAAEILGIEESELKDRFGEGESLAEMAEAEGLDVEQFKADLLAAARATLDEKVAEDKLTQERADRIYEGLSENIDELVNSEGELSLSIDGTGAEEGWHMKFGIGGESGTEEILPGLPFFDRVPVPDDEEDDADTDA